MATITSTTELAARLGVALGRMARRLRQDSTAELTMMQGAALGTLGRHGPLTPSELAARERIQRPTATRLIARLEEEGFIERTPDPHDGRCSVLTLSELGRGVLNAERTRRNAFLARRLRGLSAEDRETLERAATLLDEILEEDEV